jgi:hypothetical protein
MGKGVGNKRPTEELRARGWEIVEAGEATPDHKTYHEFLRTSKGEWSVAKHAYVAGKTGWFSCRTACYLALGRPAVVQETGWSRYIPSGEGLFAFTTMEEAVAAIDAINSNYAKHQKVCADLLKQAEIG